MGVLVVKAGQADVEVRVGSNEVSKLAITVGPKACNFSQRCHRLRLQSCIT
jgi:hypothetical protein